MNKAEPGPIHGSTTLTQTDNLNMLRHTIVRHSAIFAVCMSLPVLGIGLYYYSVSGIAPISEFPLEAIRLSVQNAWKPLLVGLIGYPVLLTVCCTVKWAFLPKANKAIAYAIDENGMTASDAAGAMLYIPWSMVKRATRTRAHLVMRLKSGGLRFASWKAFNSEDAERLWQLARAKTLIR